MGRLEDEIKLMDEWASDDEYIKLRRKYRKMILAEKQHKYEKRKITITNLLRNVMPIFLTSVGVSLSVISSAALYNIEVLDNQRKTFINYPSRSISEHLADYGIINCGKTFDYCISGDIFKIENLLNNSLIGKFIFECSEKYGIDPYVFTSIFNYENGFDRNKKNMYLDSNLVGKVFFGYDVINEEYNYIKISEDSINDLNLLIEIKMIIFQNDIYKIQKLILRKYPHAPINQINCATLLCSIQSQYFGFPIMRYIIDNYKILDSNGQFSYVNFSNGIDYVYNNAKKFGYTSSLFNDGQYIDNIFKSVLNSDLHFVINEQSVQYNLLNDVNHLVYNSKGLVKDVYE